MRALVERYGDRGLVVLGLAAEEDREREAKVARELELGYPMLLGMKEAYADYCVDGFPHTVLIDRDGIVRRRWTGFGEESAAAITSAVEEVLGGR